VVKFSRNYFILLLVVVLLIIIAQSAAAVSNLEEKIAEQNLELYTEEYGVAKLRSRDKQEIDQIFSRLTAEAKKNAPNLDFQYQIIDAPVINAAYLGAGRMILFKGLVDRVENDKQLAAIIAHELGHGVHGDIQKKLDWMQTIQLGTLLVDLASDGEVNEDGASQVTAIALNLLQKGYSRTQEKEADYYSVLLTDRAGYDSYGVVELMELLKSKQQQATDSELLEIFSDHPNLDKRINYLNNLVIKLKQAEQFYYSPMATARRLTKGLIDDDLGVVYSTYGEQVQNQLSLKQFKKQQRVQDIRNKINNLTNSHSYQLELRNEVEGTARVAVLFEQSNSSTLGLALDLQEGNYGWKIVNKVNIY
jgi:Zn-dependent protease with chaperone function